MNGLTIYPKLTKKYVLDRISQEDIMGKFLGIQVTNETLKSNSINSPYRTDNNPSCNYYYNDYGRLRFTDKTTGLNYDCFDVVARSLKIDVSTKQGFMFVLNEIAQAFRIHKYSDYKEVKKYQIIKNDFYKKKNAKPKLTIQFKIEQRKAEYRDLSYWSKGGLSLKDLNGVYFINKIYVAYNDSPFKLYYMYDPKDLCYGYYGGKDSRSIDLWKFYFPLRKKGDERGTRFKTNGSFIQGIQYLIPDKVCILTKSFKDVKVFNKLGFQSCAISAETTEPTDDEIWILKTNFDFIITCFDFDRTGIIMAKTLRDKHNFIPYMFTNGRFGSKDFKAKDAFEFVTRNSIEELKEIVKNEYHKKREEMNLFLDELNNKLNFIK